MSGHSDSVHKQATQANTNPEALSHQMPTGGSGEFHARQGQDAPQTTHGHKPGVNVGNEAVPEAHIQTLPPGSAPASATYQPNPTDTAPPPSSATSGSVNTGLGKPMQGQTNTEIRHDGQHHRKAAGGGGFDGLKSGAHGGTVDPHDPAFASQRALDKDEAVVGRGGALSAEERLPEGSETVAQEHKIGRDTRSYAS
ncbi:hypothetical protein BTJ68_08149 [Hortaea werneckii EXF-2000]|uniref:Uncharacterized protein n=1 Tax=Hortaea werneckii EXF-2000 TaxID=1157616 RepID=A0A1Z5T6J6_HORWE|nr:hypothetical protein BTJ68_08149 [Hortaea werneckii EXF-2000]